MTISKRWMLATATAAAALLCLPAEARDRVRFMNDPKDAIQKAQQTLRPLMFYVLSSSSRRDDDIEDAQKAALRDDRVLRLSQDFVPCKLSRSRYPELLEKWGIPRYANLMMVFSTPEGEMIDALFPQGLAEADSTAEKMHRVFDAYRNELYRTTLREKLIDKDAEETHLRKALAVVKTHRIASADQDVAALLDRQGLSKATRKFAFETLVELSTQAATEALLKIATGDDPQDAKIAKRALELLQPGAAEYMLSTLRDENTDKRALAYEAIAKVTRLKSSRPARWFEKVSEERAEEEIERAEKHARIVATRWRQLYGQYR